MIRKNYAAVLLILIVLVPSLSEAAGEAGPKTLKSQPDQKDCNIEATRRGYDSGVCQYVFSSGFSVTYSPETGCPARTDLLGEFEKCSLPWWASIGGASVSCNACHTCPSAAPSDKIEVGSCSITLTARGWDATDEAIKGHFKFDKGGDKFNGWSSGYMDDDSSGANCNDNDLMFKNTWESIAEPGSNLKITAAATETAAHDMIAGFSSMYISDKTPSARCRFAITDAPVSSNAPSGKKWMFDPPTAPDSTGCRTSLSDWERTWNAETIATKFKVTYCGDGQTNCGEGCDPNDPVTATEKCFLNGQPGTKTCLETCAGYGSCVTTACITSNDCDKNYCCRADTTGPPGGSGVCIGKQIDTNTAYLCDPGTWIKCDENNSGNIQTYENYAWKCIAENGEYKWIEIKYENKSRSENVISMVLKFIAFILL